MEAPRVCLSSASQLMTKKGGLLPARLNHSSVNPILLPELLYFLGACFVGSIKGMLQRHEVFARLERIQYRLLSLELFG